MWDFAGQRQTPDSRNTWTRPRRSCVRGHPCCRGRGSSFRWRRCTPDSGTKSTPSFLRRRRRSSSNGCRRCPPARGSTPARLCIGRSFFSSISFLHTSQRSSQGPQGTAVPSFLRPCCRPRRLVFEEDALPCANAPHRRGYEHRSCRSLSALPSVPYRAGRRRPFCS